MTNQPAKFQPFLKDYGNPLSPNELADKFEEMAEKFMAIEKEYINPESGNKEIPVLDFEKGFASPIPGESGGNGIDSPCHTVACHGGWAYFALTGNHDWFSLGVERLSDFLGFSRDLYDYPTLQSWAKDFPRLWNNNYGIDMFSASAGPLAFGRDDGDVMYLHDIAEHYRVVARNLRKYETDYHRRMKRVENLK